MVNIVRAHNGQPKLKVGMSHGILILALTAAICVSLWEANKAVALSKTTSKLQAELTTAQQTLGDQANSIRELQHQLIEARNLLASSGVRPPGPPNMKDVVIVGGSTAIKAPCSMITMEGVTALQQKNIGIDCTDVQAREKKR
jgi:hypothetical protein